MNTFKKRDQYLALLIACLFSTSVFAENIQSCSDTSIKTGKAYHIKGVKINVRTGANIQSSKIIDEVTTNLSGKTRYVALDYSLTVFEECSQGKWSKIRVIDPEWLSHSHQGWVSNQFLQGKNI